MLDNRTPIQFYGGPNDGKVERLPEETETCYVMVKEAPKFVDPRSLPVEGLKDKCYRYDRHKLLLGKCVMLCSGEQAMPKNGSEHSLLFEE